MPKHNHRFIARHTDGGWRYQRSIPRELRPMLGGRSHFSVYLKGASTETQAGALARVRAAQDDALFASLRRLNPAQQAEIAATGGIDAAKHTLPLLPMLRDAVTADVERRTPKAWHDPHRIERLTDGAVPAERAALMLHGWHKKTDGDVLREAQLERFEAMARVLDVAPASDDYSFKGLLALWDKVREPKRTADHERTVALLVEVCGNIDFRHVTQAHIAKFRDALEGLAKARKTTRTDKDSERKWQVRQLENVSALFSVAVSENKVAANPAKGVKVRGKAPPRKTGHDRPFTGAQVKHILDTAKSTRFGGKRHDAAMWVLRLLAYTGTRPAEITQLRKADVAKVNGVAVVHIRAQHPQQSVKNAESIRTVPLHPAVAGFVAWATKSKTDFVFACFPWNKHKGRRGWFDQEFGPFLRDVCGIDAPGLSLYSMRHRFHDAMRNAQLADDRQKYLVGHASGDVHGRYGRGADLRELAKDVVRVNVFKD